MEIRLLGPVEVWLDDRPVELGPRQQRFVLAVLALEPGRLISVDRLIDLLWSDRRPPRSARNTVQVRVFGLRTVLGERLPIRTGDGGYLLDVAAERIDAHRFWSLIDSGRSATDPAERVRMFRSALELWRGRALAGISADDGVRERLARDLEENRLLAYEELLDAELQLGNEGQVLTEIADLRTEHPDRERLVRLHMSALAHSGETSRALEVARTYRERIAEELGLDPSPRFQELELAILRNELPQPSSETSPKVVVRQAKPAVARPAQLPPAAPGFTGRVNQLLELDMLLPESLPTQSRIGVISGAAGIGKTGLAVHWSHQRTENFPDGQLYLDLRGHAEEPAVQPIDALGQLLRGLGVAADAVPGAVDEASALFRTTLASKRVLVLLDNAASPEQVRPLLPAEPGCLALVTSRNRLSGLVAKEGASRLVLEPLALDDANDLLANLLGPVRTAAQPDAVSELADVCGRLPLAIRITAAQLADEPHQSLASFARTLQDRPLEALALEGDERSAVAAVFDLSYQRLEPAEQRLFRLLGLTPGLDFDVYAAAALVEESVEEASARLRRLRTASLLNEHAAGRYRFHDLIRHFASAKADVEESTLTRTRALERLFAWYHQTAATASGFLYPSSLRIESVSVPERLPVLQIDGERDALAWLEIECDNLLASVEADPGERTELHRWQCCIANAQRHYLDDRSPLAVRRANAAAAVRAAERTQDDKLLADAYLEQGYVDVTFDRRSGIANFERALEFAERCDDKQRVASLLHNIGACHYEIGEFDVSERYLLRATTAKQDFAGPDSVAATLNALAKLDLLCGRLPAALERCEQARSLDTKQHRLALTLENQAELLLQLGRPDEALAVCDEAGRVARQVERRTTLVHVLALRARIQNAQGEWRTSLDDAQHALEIAEEIANPDLLAPALNALAETQCHQGDLETARATYLRALEICGSGNLVIDEAHALRGLAEVELALGRTEVALVRAKLALAFARERQLVVYEGHALALVAKAELDLGDQATAAGHAAEAVIIHQRTGHRFGLAEATALVSSISSG